MGGIRLRVSRRTLHTASRRTRLALRLAARAAGALALAAVVIGGVRLHSFATAVAAPPEVNAAPPIIESLIDSTPVPITTTVLWHKVPIVVTTHALLHDRTVWRRMHFDDWDRVPPDLRHQGIHAMLAAHGRALAGPDQWARMSTFDWDKVPQPVRAIAYLRMVDFWTRAERVGEDFGWRSRDVAPTIAAIVMVESWFEHRAVNENEWGNRDLGLAQCSDHCRETLGALARAGDVPFLLEEEQYYNPWFAARVAVVWFKWELQRAQGDIELAIRAYHRGQAQALDERGDRYLANVLDKRARFIRNTRAPDSWQVLVDEAMKGAW